MTWQHIHVPKKTLFVLSFVTSMITNATKSMVTRIGLGRILSDTCEITTSEKHTPHLKSYSTLFNSFATILNLQNHTYFWDHVLSMPHGGSQGASPRSTKCKRPTLEFASPPAPRIPSIRTKLIYSDKSPDVYGDYV